MRCVTMLACLSIALLVGSQTTNAKPAPAPQQDPAARRPQPGPRPAPPADPKGPFNIGPIKAELTAMQQVRTLYFDDAERSEAESNFAMRVRIQGEKIGRVARMGNLILTELVDDTGHSMIDDELYTEEMKTSTRRMTVPAQRLEEFGLFVASRARPSAPAARKITKLRGSVKLILAEETEKITILNPMQFYGGKIADPRLDKAGIELHIVKAEEFEPAAPEQCIIVEMKTKADHVVSVNFHDEWMKPVLKRERPYETRDGRACTGYCFQNATFDDQMQMVIEYYPSIEEIIVPVTAENIDLP